ncbi:MAG: class I SAM-dependent methyltransferase [Aggregatilineales bacterium]
MKYRVEDIIVLTPQNRLESVGCDLCGAAANQAREVLWVRDRIYGLPGEFTLVRCEACGLLYLNPRPDRAQIGAYYPDLNYHAFKASGGVKSRLLAIRREREARALLAGLPDQPMALEIGCGTGELLAALKAHGARVVGVEPNSAAAQIGTAQYGLTIHVGMLEDVPDSALPPGSFDLAVMKYALEHVHNPREVLMRIATLLKPGGRAVFWLPNADSWEMRLFGTRWRGLDAPRHLYIFTPATIRRYAETVGLKVIEVAYSGVPNDWAGSLSESLSGSLPALVALWPVSVVAALFHKAGRIRVTLAKLPDSRA